MYEEARLVFFSNNCFAFSEPDQGLNVLTSMSWTSLSLIKTASV